MNKIAKILIPRADITPLFYEIPSAYTIVPGDIVEVEVRRSLTWGLVLTISESLPKGDSFSLKPIRGPIFSSLLAQGTPRFAFIEWLADYYLYALPKVIKQVISPYLKQNRTLRGPLPAPESKAVSAVTFHTPPLTDEQNRVYHSISTRYQANDYKPTLLYGITGSGKSEVYMAIIKDIILQKRQVLYLVPEIGLVEPTVRFLQKRTNADIVTIHSFLRPKQRFLHTAAAMTGIANIVVGTRSALLNPPRNLGLIVVDEEHDDSYKNFEPPYYHGRDAAVMLAHMLKIPIILGSATPSSESWYNTDITGKYYKETLHHRYGKGKLPRIRLFPYKGDHYLPPMVVSHISRELEARNNALFFLNRRGHSTIALCEECGTIQECPLCKTAMIYHRKQGKLVCHHCGRLENPNRCLSCGSSRIRLEGMGIEKLAESLNGYFPGIQLFSVDRDSVPSDKKLQTVMNDIHHNSGSIILGTIMISKGHNFPDLHAAVIKFADYMLQFRDYRAAEHCYQIVTQVAGRVGRTGENGEVWAEAVQPDHYIWEHIINSDYEGFIKEELEWREELFLPPFSRIAVVKISGKDENTVAETAEKLYKTIRKYGNITVQPPVKPPLYRVMGKHRLSITVTALRHSTIKKAILQTLQQTVIPKKIICTVDIDALTI